jgi:N-methylhydantoinase A
VTKRAVVSIDVGGTFTDVLVVGIDGAICSYKFTNSDKSSVSNFLRQFEDSTTTFLYSTTAAVNAILSGDLPSIGLILNEGFRELLETARLPTGVGKDKGSQLPRKLVPLEFVREASCRITHDGTVTRPVNREQIQIIAADFKRLAVKRVVVALLHSYRFSEQEEEISELFATYAPDIEVILSCDVLSESREYERAVAAVLSASLGPLLKRNLEGLMGVNSEAKRILVMQGNGGLASANSVLEHPLTTIFSGPVAAVTGMTWLAGLAGYENLITFDVGGTSTDVSLIRNGEYETFPATIIAGFPLKIPMVDVLSVGAGGGSIASEAADKRWHVGPNSAGADPGPVCYALGGTQPTLTDANLVLGRIPKSLLGGKMALDENASLSALADFGSTRSLSAEAAARGILEIAINSMCGAIRRVSVLRGREPANLTLVAMGGAGPMFAAEVADLIGITRVIIPPDPSLAAALGVYVADVTRDFSSALGSLADTVSNTELELGFGELTKKAKAWIESEGLEGKSCTVVGKLDLRYEGMVHETTVECLLGGDLENNLGRAVELFHQRHAELTGRDWKDYEKIEIVNLRLVVNAGQSRSSPFSSTVLQQGNATAPSSKRIFFHGGTASLESQTHQRKDLKPSSIIVGPALIEQESATTVIPPKWNARIDEIGNLIMRSD